ncbi:PREDICTED: RNA exonuclease 4-like [Priapulus caudatus]|uniref:RNA exonuclease 4 n=1 Tax=Priapulus caudatus TaxID=37621 RepID=A0ABM1FBJ7_PRICU|nr:PREDICTED: RNA exonuclease 4-like [Priapulus caudatus]XP_014681819.1 PREDICTED: RNA exonuclease 4-like [Priapulus caudatus]
MSSQMADVAIHNLGKKDRSRMKRKRPRRKSKEFPAGSTLDKPACSSSVDGQRRIKKKRKRRKLNRVTENGGGKCDENVHNLTAKLKSVFTKTSELKQNRKQIARSKRETVKSAVTQEECQTGDILNVSNSTYIALDCEMVGVGLRKHEALARCSLVDYEGNILMDEYVRPTEPITDYRTKWSGIRPSDMYWAVPFCVVQDHVRRICQDKIIIGHAVHNDFRVLLLNHPKHLVMDTSFFKPLRVKAGLDPTKTASLKHLTLALLGRSIQKFTHCSVEDARATMEIFRSVQQLWECERGITNSCTAAAATAADPVCDSGYSSTTETAASFLEDEFWPDDLN